MGVGLGAIAVESCAMTLAAHRANHSLGNLPLTFAATLLAGNTHTICPAAGLHRAVGVAIVPVSGVGLREGTASHR